MDAIANVLENTEIIVLPRKVAQTAGIGYHTPVRYVVEDGVLLLIRQDAEVEQYSEMCICPDCYEKLFGESEENDE